MVYINAEGVRTYSCALGVSVQELRRIWLKPQGKGKIEW